jgi:hypothetical protein
MNIYNIIEYEKEIEKIAQENDGEIPEDLLKKLMESTAHVPAQLEKFCKYIKHLEQFEKTAKEEIERIKALKEKSEKRRENLKKYMTPFIKTKGKMEVGTFKLSTRASERLELDESISFDEYKKEKVTYTIDKQKIKEDIKNGKKVNGACLKKCDNLQIK